MSITNDSVFEEKEWRDENGYTYHFMRSYGVESWWMKIDGVNVRHRLDGPALIDHRTGNCDWYYNGELMPCLNQEEFERLIKLELFW